MTTLTVTAQGQVKFRNVVLKHLGVRPGGKFRLDAQTLERGAAPTPADPSQAGRVDAKGQGQPARH